MKISIIICTYNSEETLNETLNSIKNQTLQNYEVIVIDGKSNDKTLEIVNSHRDIVSLVISEGDNGVYDAMNKGLKNASGDIVGFLNSDDYYYRNSVLSDISIAFKSNKINIYYADLIYVSNDKSRNIKRFWKSNYYYDKYLEDGWIPAHPTFYVRRELFEHYGTFNLKYKIAADYDLMVRMLLKQKEGNVHYNPKVDVAMREGGLSNSTFKNKLLQNTEIFRVWREIGYDLPVKLFVKKFYRKLLQIILLNRRKKISVV